LYCGKRMKVATPEKRGVTDESIGFGWGILLSLDA
jgi:hypothetical protein